MSELIHLPASFTAGDGVVVVEFNLTLDNHVEDVWSALVDSDRLAQWLATGSIEPRLGGLARFDFEASGGAIYSRVTAWDPPRELAYSWNDSETSLRPVHWTLSPLGPMTQLTLRLHLPDSEDVARAAAGWAAHLEMLWAMLMGVSVKYPYAAFKAAQETFRAQLAAAAQPVVGPLADAFGD